MDEGWPYSMLLPLLFMWLLIWGDARSSNFICIIRPILKFVIWSPCRNMELNTKGELGCTKLSWKVLIMDVQGIQKNMQHFWCKVYLLFSRVEKHVIHEWKFGFMESLCACGFHVNTCSIWDPSTLWTYYIWTTQMSNVSHNMSSVIFLATASISTCILLTICGLVQYTQSMRK